MYGRLTSPLAPPLPYYYTLFFPFPPPSQAEGAAACGMCIEVTKAENMPDIHDELTRWDYAKDIKTPFIAMIFDQCTDPICETGYLDFDVYDENQPVEKGEEWWWWWL